MACGHNCGGRKMTESAQIAIRLDGNSFALSLSCSGSGHGFGALLQSTWKRLPDEVRRQVFDRWTTDVHSNVLLELSDHLWKSSKKFADVANGGFSTRRSAISSPIRWPGFPSSDTPPYSSTVPPVSFLSKSPPTMPSIVFAVMILWSNIERRAQIRGQFATSTPPLAFARERCQSTYIAHCDYDYNSAACG